MTEGLPPPPVKWAQRDKLIFVTICLDDCKIDTLAIESEKLHFKGNGGTEKKDHECVINFYDEVSRFRQMPKERQIEIIIEKKTEAWWPRLVKLKGRVPYISIDWKKWRDEDDGPTTDDEPQQEDGLQIEWTEKGIEHMMDEMDQRPPDLGNYEKFENEFMPPLEDENELRKAAAAKQAQMETVKEVQEEKPDLGLDE